MTKRYLVVDNGWIRKNEGCFQYVIVDVEGDMKTFSNYTCLRGNIHCNSLAKMTQDAFDKHGCDYIVLDCCGTGMSILDSLNRKYLDYVATYKQFAQNTSDGLHSFTNDIVSGSVFIEKDSIELYKAIRFLHTNTGLYFDPKGLLKLNWGTLDNGIRKLFHIINSFYMGTHCGKGVMLLKDDEILKERFSI